MVTRGELACGGVPIVMRVKIMLHDIINPCAFPSPRDELRRLDAVLAQPGAFAAIWGRRRVGKDAPG